MEKKKINIFKTWQILRLNKKKKIFQNCSKKLKAEEFACFSQKSISKMEVLLKHAVGHTMKDQMIIKRAKSQKPKAEIEC